MNFPSFKDSKIVYSILFFCMQASLPLGRWRGIVSALLPIISHPAGAQNEPIRLGVIESRDLTAAPFGGDSAASAAPGAVTLASRLTLRNAVYSAAQYPSELYRLMLEKQGEKLIIQKKTSG